MGLKAHVTGGGGNYEKPKPGTYLGICNGIYNCGRQDGYKGGEPKGSLYLTFELHKSKGPARDSQGRIFEVGAKVTHTANIKSALIAKYAGNMRGKDYTEGELLDIQRKHGGYDPEPLLGLPCKLTLELGDSGYPVIKTVTKLDPEDDVVPDMETDTVYWDYTMEGEVPRRVAWLWATSLDNPAREGQAAMVGLPAGKFAAVADTSDIPF